MTGPRATALAARITAAIAADLRPGDSEARAAWWLADRERVRLDLAGYLRALDGLAEHAGHHLCGSAYCMDPDARRYADWRDGHLAALTLTGSLYGVTA